MSKGQARTWSAFDDEVLRALHGNDHGVSYIATFCADEDVAKQEREKRERSAQTARRRKLKELVEIAGIPARYANRSLDDYKVTCEPQRMALAICRAYAQTWEGQFTKGGSLVLTGGVGTGKTHLACGIANQIMPAHMASVAFGTVASVIRGVRSTYGGRGERSESQALADLLKPDLLIVDEVGAASGTDHELQLLFEIINNRYQALRPMILISNLNADDLEKFLGQRAMDRFRECGTVVACTWPSHRGKERG